MTRQMKPFRSPIFGGDYNPEQWPRAIWTEDMSLLQQAHVNTVSINIFSWAQLQPGTDHYDFEQLDAIVRTATDAGMWIVMGTATAAFPAWMARQFPDITRTDIRGHKRHHGDRHNACPNSPTYRKYAPRLAGHLAQRYGDNPNLILWHISNEYGGYCYCSNCATAFRGWLEERYGNIDGLNQAWGSEVWGHHYSAFEDIFPPDLLGDAVDDNRSFLPPATLDYRRFQSDSLLDIYRLERDAIAEYDPDTPMTTNFMLDYPMIDYQSWAPYLDVVSWDAYPEEGAPAYHLDFWHSLMRGIKDGDPFLLMEQTPSRANWQKYNTLKRPGQMRELSYQAMAHGSDSIQFFQVRRSRSGPEKFHGAFIDHDGTSKTRVFGELAELGQELENMGSQILGARTPSKVAIIFDWPSWWAILGSVGPSAAFDYLSAVRDYYAPFHDQNIPADVVPVGANLDEYEVVLAPYLFIVEDETAKKFTSFVEKGGRLLLSTMTSIVDGNDRCHMGGVPGPLRKIAGLWAEETDALPPQQAMPMLWATSDGEMTEAGTVSTLFDVVHLEGAQQLAVYGGNEFYAGRPAFSVNEWGEGRVYYASAIPDAAATTRIAQTLIDGLDIEGIETHDGVFAPARVSEDGTTFRFYLNTVGEVRNVTPQAGVDILTGAATDPETTLELEPYGVAIIREG